MSSARNECAQLSVVGACVYGAGRVSSGLVGVLVHWPHTMHVRSVVLGMVHVVCVVRALRVFWYLHGACTGCILPTEHTNGAHHVHG
jgi:hypothetical protein